MMRSSSGFRTAFAAVIAALFITVPAGVVLADPSLISGATGAAAQGAAGVSESVDAVSDTAAGTTASAAQTVNDAVDDVADAASAAGDTVGGAASGAAEAASGAATSVTDAASGAAQAGSEAAEAVNETVDEAVGTAAETVEETTEAAAGAVSEAIDAVAETAEGAAGSANPGGAADPAPSATNIVVGGSHADVPATNGASSADAPAAVVRTGTETTVPAGTLIEFDRAASGGLVAAESSQAVRPDPSVGQSFGLGTFDARARVGGSAGSTCEINLHRGRETADLPCPGGSSVLGLFLGVTGVALVSLVALALALTMTGTGAIALERRLQRG
jgi:hypothetical protein